METKETVATEVVNLSNKNEKLCQELTEIDQLAQQLERHKEEVLETADKELGEAKVPEALGSGHGPQALCCPDTVPPHARSDPLVCLFSVFLVLCFSNPELVG